MRLHYVYSWFVLAIVLFIVTNVLGRFFFDLRFDFAVDIVPQLYGALIILGASYSLSKGSHIRTDIFFKNYSDRTKDIIDLMGYFMFFPAFGGLLYYSVIDSYKSITMWEKSSATMMQMIIWPYKLSITFGLFLLLICGIQEVRKLCLRL
jgi:TRAP-type mannitol/chloroaromatic compound transport system permease small subunit